MKTINRHNYEEFFLLYADAELSVTEKQAVEQFVESNPDLMDEFALLLQLQLPSDTILFHDKECLLRNESIEINLNNYEENFLLYVDNELISTEKEKVETFVLQHPETQENFTLLKQTQLLPESIVFPYKHSLYRKEEKEKPLFYLQWSRIAVAAVFLGVAVLVGTLLQNNNVSNQQIAKLNSATNIHQQPGQESTFSTSKNNSTPRGKAIRTESAFFTDNEKPIALSVRKNIRPDIIDNSMAFTNPVAAEKKSNSIATVTTESTIGIPSTITGVLSEKTTIVSNDVVPSTIDNSESITAFNNALPVVYKELDTEDEKKSLYLGSIEINKDKLRGFFRKAGSLFRSKERQQEDEKSDIVPVTNAQSLK